MKEFIQVCAQCESDEIGEVFSGDEGVTVCRNCRAIEGGYAEKEVTPGEIVDALNGQFRREAERTGGIGAQIKALKDVGK